MAHVKREEESAPFRGVAKRTGVLVPLAGAAFCSRVESATVVIGVSCLDKEFCEKKLGGRGCAY